MDAATSGATAVPIFWPAKDLSRIPFAAYHAREVYEQEQEKIFRGPTWNYLALEAELPEPGDFTTTLLGDTPTLVSRDEGGVVHAFVNRCKHRGATLRREACGKATNHSCIYHQWAYNLKGNLASVPFIKGMKGEGGMSKDFDKDSIHSTPCASKSTRA